MATTDQEKTYDKITTPFDCPVYRANLARVTISDCGLCACTHCIQQCLENDGTCRMCSRCNRSLLAHTFTELATDTSEVIHGLLTLKDKEIEKGELIVQERDKMIEELQNQMEISGNPLQVYVQMCAEDAYIWGNIVPEFQGRLAEMEDQLEMSGKYINVLENGVNQLQGYVQLCADQDVQLKHIWRNIIPEYQGHLAELEDQLEESGNDIRILEDEEKIGGEITAPFDCPIYRANLEKATIADCGLCMCTHCVQQCNESDKTCSLCNRSLLAHTFTEHATDSPEVIDALFRIKDKEIERRKLIIQERDKTVEELQSKLLHGQLMTAVVRLEEDVEKVEIYVQHCLEKDTDLQNLHENIIPEKDKTIEDQKNEILYLERIQKELAEHVKSLQEEVQDVKEENTELNNTLTKTEKDAIRLEEQLEVYEQLFSNKEGELNNLLEHIIPQKEKIIDDQQNEIVNLIDKLKISEYQLQVNVDMCAEQDAQLKYLWGNTIPELQGRLAEMEDIVATFRRETVSIANFKTLSGTSLCTAIQHLQRFYDREYRCRYDVTDKMDVLLQTRLEDVLSELLNVTPEIGDQLSLVIRTYISLVVENSNLHRSIKTQDHTINDMKTELRQTKAIKLQMEQRNMTRCDAVEE